jgi:hypothetical protein
MLAARQVAAGQERLRRQAQAVLVLQVLMLALLLAVVTVPPDGRSAWVAWLAATPCVAVAAVLLWDMAPRARILGAPLCQAHGKNHK